MSAETGIRREFKLSRRLRVVMSAPRPAPGAICSMVCEWQPRRPARLTPEESAAYSRAMAAFGGELAQAMREARQ